MQRTIMHVDMDAFFAAVEQRDHPEYRGQPVIVGARPGMRGVVSTCSYEARRFGIHSAMPIGQAFHRCPQGIFLPPDFERYSEASEQVMEVLEGVSPLVETVSIDEAYVDISGCTGLFGSPTDIGMRARRLIAKRVRLTASVGIGPNRLVAKIASDACKPDGLLVVTPAEVQAFLDPLPVRCLRGVGLRSLPHFARVGLRTIADVRAWPPEELQREFGQSWGDDLFRQARGQSSDRVGGLAQRKQISKELTFNRDETDEERLHDTLLRLSASVGRSARAAGVAGQVIQLKLRLAGFETHTRRTTLETATNADRTIFRVGWDLFKQSGFAGRPVRLIGIGVSAWDEAGTQLDLFTEPQQPRREQRLYRAIDTIAQKYGHASIGLGVSKRDRSGKDGSGKKRTEGV
jgi:DNA polymerase IV